MGCCATGETDATGDLSFETTDLKKEGDFEPFGDSFTVVICYVISKVYISQLLCLPIDCSNKPIRFVRMKPEGTCLEVYSKHRRLTKVDNSAARGEIAILR